MHADAHKATRELIHHHEHPVERAFRSIFAVAEPEWVARIRPRTVDLQRAMQEQERWQKWDPEQARMESDFEARDAPSTSSDATSDTS
jgi:hypothetical protein